jgi:hypothetical protein
MTDKEKIKELRESLTALLKDVMNAKKFLLNKQWSMGNGQCPECCGVPENWLGHPCHLDSSNLGHKKNCPLAKALEDVGVKPLYVGQSKLKKKYENYITEQGCYSTRLKTKNGCPILKEENRKFQEKFDNIIFKALTSPT